MQGDPFTRGALCVKVHSCYNDFRNSTSTLWGARVASVATVPTASVQSLTLVLTDYASQDFFLWNPLGILFHVFFQKRGSLLHRTGKLLMRLFLLWLKYFYFFQESSEWWANFTESLEKVICRVEISDCIAVVSMPNGIATGMLFLIALWLLGLEARAQSSEMGRLGLSPPWCAKLQWFWMFTLSLTPPNGSYTCWIKILILMVSHTWLSVASSFCCPHWTWFWNRWGGYPNLLLLRHIFHYKGIESGASYLQFQYLILYKVYLSYRI